MSRGTTRAKVKMWTLDPHRNTYTGSDLKYIHDTLKQTYCTWRCSPYTHTLDLLLFTSSSVWFPPSILLPSLGQWSSNKTFPRLRTLKASNTNTRWEGTTASHAPGHPCFSFHLPLKSLAPCLRQISSRLFVVLSMMWREEVDVGGCACFIAACRPCYPAQVIDNALCVYLMAF